MTPETWLLVLSFVTGFNLAATAGLVAAGAYAGWRYVYKPWQIVREDQKRLAERLETVTQEIGLRKAMALTDEEQAAIERRARTRQLWAANQPAMQVPRG